MRNRALFFVVFFGIAVASVWAQTEEQRNFPRFNFNAGSGLGIGRGAVGSFVGNSYFGVGGGGVNFSRLFGVSAEYMYYKLDLRPSVSNDQGLPDATGSLNSVSLNGIARLPYHLGRWGAYGIFGVGFYRRSVSTTRGEISPSATCQPAWVWWDIQCFKNQPLPGQTLSSFSKDAGGYNYGGGATYRLKHWHDAKLYAEWRYHKAYHSDVQTIVWPVTVGLRW